MPFNLYTYGFLTQLQYSSTVLTSLFCLGLQYMLAESGISVHVLSLRLGNML
jgi:hypothetical protein